MNTMNEAQDLQSHLENAYQQGIDLFLDGEPSSPSVIERFLREDTAYMADFVFDDEGKLSQIRCDRVDKNEPI